MIKKPPQSYTSGNVIYPQAFSRKHGPNSKCPWSREMLVWLRADAQPAPGETILSDYNVIRFPANRRVGWG